MFVQDEEEPQVSTMRVFKPAEEETGGSDEVLGGQTEPQQGFVNHPG